MVLLSLRFHLYADSVFYFVLVLSHSAYHHHNAEGTPNYVGVPSMLSMEMAWARVVGLWLISGQVSRF